MLSRCNIDNRLVFSLARVRKKSLALRHKTIAPRFNVLEHKMAAGIATLGFGARPFHAQQRDAGPRNSAAVLDVDDTAFYNSGRRVFWRVLGRKRDRQRRNYKNRSKSTCH